MLLQRAIGRQEAQVFGGTDAEQQLVEGIAAAGLSRIKAAASLTILR